MKKILKTIPVFIILLFPINSWANDPEVKEAHIYMGEAVFTVTMPEKITTIDLPGTVDIDSIALETSDDLTVLSYSIEQRPRSHWIPSALADLSSKIEKSREELEGKNSVVESLEQAIKYLDETRPEIAPQEISSYISSLLEIRSDLTRKLLKAKTDWDLTQKETIDLENLLLARLPEDGNGMIRISANTVGKGELRIRCSTNQAQWTPTYRLDLDLAKSTMTARLDGMISQKTGLNFSGKVNLHTASPSIHRPNLDLVPMTVRLETPADMEASSYAMDGARALGVAAPIPMASKANMAVEETLTDRVFSFESTIPGDGVPSIVVLESWTAEVKSTMIAVPSITSSLWLLAEGVIPGGSTIEAPGEMYVDHRFAGRGYMPRLVRGENFSIPFGEIPGVQISREKKIPKSGSNWIGKGTLRQGYVIKVTNGLSRRSDIVVKDRIPVPTSDKISLSMVEMSPAPESTDPKTGIVTWTVSLEPGEVKEVNVLYDLKYPSDMELVFSR